MTITPTLAAHWVEQFNLRNRKMSEKIVDEYATHLLDGEWRLNGESIKFDTAGNLIDGQHRLAAVVKSGKAMTTLVVWGLDEESYETVDTGKKRITADAMHRDGEANSTLLAATLGVQWRFDRGYIASSIKTGKYKPSTVALKETLIRHPLIRVSVSWVGRTKARRLAPTSILAFAHYQFSVLDPVLCEQFFHALTYGEDLGSAHPIYRLRERLLDNRTSKGKLGNVYILALIIKTWNAWVLPRSLRTLVWRDDEAFPEIHAPTTNGFPPPGP